MSRLDPAVVKREIENLLVAFPELEDDETLRHDCIEAETDAHALLSQITRRIGADKALAASTATYIDELRERQARIDRRVDAYRTMALAILEAAKLKKAELPEATLSVAKGRERVIVSDPDSVPDEMCKITKTPSLIAIRAALERGERFNFAAIVQGEPTLTMRVK